MDNLLNVVLVAFFGNYLADKLVFEFFVLTYDECLLFFNSGQEKFLFLIFHMLIIPKTFTEDRQTTYH